VMPGGQMGSVVAFNKVDGTVAWTAGKDAASYASPMLTAVEGQTVLVFQTQVAVVGLNPQDGTEFFRIPLRDLLNESSTTPVRIGDILFASSVTFGSLGSRLRRIGEKVEVQPVWRNNSLTCYFGTPVVHGEYLYAVTGQLLKPRATLHCIDPKTGTSRWNKPGVGTYHATLLKTREHLLMLEEQGDLVLVEPYPAEYRELSRTKVCSMTWAHPAYAQGLLLVRDARTLKAIRLPVQ
ncbi:MAG TPA: PQQ-binding-like beta-propeller repeat protein, partial [Gemmatales bacterium]|nr:PQQ-binding-like beta-propeller repeat protein [Gemmatales bacterium]